MLAMATSVSLVLANSFGGRLFGPTSGEPKRPEQSRLVNENRGPVEEIEWAEVDTNIALVAKPG